MFEPLIARTDIVEQPLSNPKQLVKWISSGIKSNRKVRYSCSGMCTSLRGPQSIGIQFLYLKVLHYCTDTFDWTGVSALVWHGIRS